MATQEQQKPVVVRPGGGADAVYGIGMIGATAAYNPLSLHFENLIEPIGRQSAPS